MNSPRYEDVSAALKRLGRRRTLRAQKLALAPPADGIGGALVLAFGMRETWCRNIEGGLMKAPDGSWVKQTDPSQMDVGFLQINRRFHFDALQLMGAVADGTWDPPVLGNPTQAGKVPRFGQALLYTLELAREAMDFADDSGIPERDHIRFAVVAHNAGVGGALKGFREGLPDKYTTGGDYSAWVFEARDLIRRFLDEHERWRYTP